ncbi:hypothetical protein [Brevundimonas sp. SL130]|uniref:hypothetical protein n=1 Tax=Brevundimonas sp. SL130 TaxID=2995143 RepID=UPI00226C8516|nr:hypothetical protein [Brevundimonas sp. SL130]WAC59549.1 hypothetical protein OU998_15235 [Brevundimonas sp. SL130]
MTRFVTPVLIAATLAAVATPSLAQSTRSQTAQPAKLQSVMVCATDAATRRAYQREFGAAPVFVTAQEAVEARQAGQRWAAPRCMTERQYDRLVSMTQTRASL